MTITSLTTPARPAPAETAPVSADRPWPHPAYAWYVVSILILAYAFAILDRAAIGLLVDPIKADLGLTDSQIGLLQGLAFALCYTLCGLPVGVLADRWKRIPLLAIGIALWSAATVACGAARNVGGLFLARVGVGLGEATVTPVSGSLIADYFPPERRGRAYGFWMLGSSLGTSMASLFAAVGILVSERLDATGVAWAAGLKVWQITFFLIGAPGLLVALLFYLTVREPVRRGPRVENPGLGPTFGHLRRNIGAYATLIGGAVLNVTCIYAALGWLPTLFIRIHEWSPAKVGSLFALVALPTSVFGAVAGGWMMSWLSRRGRKDAPILLAAAHSLSILICGTATVFAPTPELALGLNGVMIVASPWSYAAAMTGLNQISPNQMRGQVAAVYTVFTGLVSMTIGAYAVGFLSDNVFHGRSGVAPSLASVFVVCASLGLTALILGRRAYEAAERKSEAAVSV